MEDRPICEHKFNPECHECQETMAWIRSDLIQDVPEPLTDILDIFGD